MVFWSFITIWIILLLPLGYYYDSHPDIVPPEGLQKIYDIELFSWEVTLVISSTVIVFLFGNFLIWVGIHEMNMGKVKTYTKKADRRRIVKKFSSEKYMNNLRKEIYGENYDKLKKV